MAPPPPFNRLVSFSRCDVVWIFISCCVFGVPDPTWGESVLAVCKLDQDKELTQEEVREFVGSKIAGFKKPRKVIFVEDIPIKNYETDRESVKEMYGS